MGRRSDNVFVHILGDRLGIWVEIMYTPKHFKASELVPRGYERYWLILMDERILRTLDAIREHYNRPVLVNHAGMQNRGWRPPNSTVGGKLSQHRFGRAVDLSVSGISAETVRNDIRSGLFPLITAIEKDVSWVHIDVRNVERLMEFEA